MQVPRREPVFTLPEVAERLGVGITRLQGLMRHHAGFNRHMTVGNGGRHSVSPRRYLYRMSDARRWWAGLPDNVKEIASCTSTN